MNNYSIEDINTYCERIQTYTSIGLDITDGLDGRQRVHPVFTLICHMAMCDETFGVEQTWKTMNDWLDSCSEGAPCSKNMWKWLYMEANVQLHIERYALDLECACKEMCEELPAGFGPLVSMARSKRDTYIRELMGDL